MNTVLSMRRRGKLFIVAASLAPALWMTVAVKGAEAARSTGVAIPRFSRPISNAQNCTFSAGTDQCALVLPADFYGSDKRSASRILRPLLSSLNQKTFEGRRQVVCAAAATSKCPTDQYVNTFVNPDARRFDLGTLKDNEAIIVAKMRLTSGRRADRKYQVGDNMPENLEVRGFAFVAFPSPLVGTDKPSDGGKILARWTLFQITHENQVWGVDSLRSGDIVDCVPPHPGKDPNLPEDGFTPCSGASIYRKIAKLGNGSMRDAFRIVSCASGNKQTCGGTRRAFSVGVYRKRIRQPDARTLFDEAVQEAVTAGLDVTADAYWFTCSIGCCTATT